VIFTIRYEGGDIKNFKGIIKITITPTEITITNKDGTQQVLEESIETLRAHISPANRGEIKRDRSRRRGKVQADLDREEMGG